MIRSLMQPKTRGQHQPQGTLRRTAMAPLLAVATATLLMPMMPITWMPVVRRRQSPRLQLAGMGGGRRGEQGGQPR